MMGSARRVRLLMRKSRLDIELQTEILIRTFTRARKVFAKFLTKNFRDSRRLGENAINFSKFYENFLGSFKAN